MGGAGSSTPVLPLDTFTTTHSPVQVPHCESMLAHSDAAAPPEQLATQKLLPQGEVAAARIEVLEGEVCQACDVQLHAQQRLKEAFKTVRWVTLEQLILTTGSPDGAIRRAAAAGPQPLLSGS